MDGPAPSAPRPQRPPHAAPAEVGAGAAEAAYARYRRTGDPAAFGAFFDATAPVLFRTALSLCRDAPTAEDVLQETFLAALGALPAHDAGRPVLPWLLGILHNRVRRARRASARAPDPRRVLAQLAFAARGEEGAQADPVEPPDGPARAALDALPEPYRAVALLRWRYGLEPAEIAHVRSEAPGTTRSLLSRALARLRRALRGAPAAALPGPGLPELEPLRGRLLAEAAGRWAPWTPPSPAGGPLMAALSLKQGLLATAAVAALAALWLAADGPAAPGRHRPRADGAAASEAADAPGTALAGAPRLEGRSTAASAAAADAAPREPDLGAAGRRLTGLVLGAEDGEPRAGAELTLFPARRQRLGELFRRAGGVLLQDATGRVHGGPGRPSLPLLLTPPPRGAGPDVEVVALEEPRADDPPSARTRSRADGTFELPLTEGACLLVAQEPGFQAAFVALREPPPGALTVRLGRGRRLVGSLLDAEGQPYLGPLRIHAQALASAGPALAHAPLASTVLEARGGVFEGRLEAEWVLLRSLDPALRLVPDAAPSPATHVTARLTAAGEADEPVALRALPAAALHVVEARTGRPVEVVSVCGRDRVQETVAWTGRFFAPGGVLPLFGDGEALGRARGAPFGFDLWAEGFEPVHLELADLPATGAVRVALEPGSAPALVGEVRDRAGPVAGAAVLLLGYRRIAWTGTEEGVVTAAASGSDGTFRLLAAAGSYLLRVQAPGALAERTVELPARARLVIDLDDGTSIHVTVVDERGEPRAGHVVGLSGPDGRSARAYADDRGRARFERLTPGRYRVLAPYLSTQGSFGGDVLVPVEVEAGRASAVRLTVPAGDRPVRGRLLLEGGGDPSRWRLRPSARDAEPWTAVAPDGALELPAGARELELEGPGGLRYGYTLPVPVPVGTTLRPPLGGPSYEGVLVDAASGAPWAGVRVTAFTPGAQDGEPTDPRPSAVTDDAGRFRLPCARATPVVLTFSDQPERAAWFRGGLEHASFRPGAGPAPGGRSLEIALPRAGRPGRAGPEGPAVARLSGCVRSRDTGAPLDGATVSATALEEQADGTLLLTAPRRWFGRTDAQGRFEVEAPRTGRYRLAAHAGEGAKPVDEQTFDADPEATALERDLGGR